MMKKSLPFFYALFLFFLFMLVNLVISTGIQILYVTEKISQWQLKLLLSLAFFVPLLIVVVFNHHKIHIKIIKKTEFYFLVFILAVSLQILGTSIEKVTATAISGTLLEYHLELKEFLLPEDSLDLLVSLFTIGLVAPFCEEYFFRGILLSALMKSYSFRVANAVQALLFGLAHINIFQLFYGIPAGLLFGYLYKKTGNLWIPIILHAATNSLSLIFSFVIPNTTKETFGEFFSPENIELQNFPWEVSFFAFLLSVITTFLIVRTHKDNRL